MKIADAERTFNNVLCFILLKFLLKIIFYDCKSYQYYYNTTMWINKEKSDNNFQLLVGIIKKYNEVSLLVHKLSKII